MDIAGQNAPYHHLTTPHRQDIENVTPSHVHHASERDQPVLAGRAIPQGRKIDEEDRIKEVSYKISDQLMARLKCPIPVKFKYLLCVLSQIGYANEIVNSVDRFLDPKRLLGFPDSHP